ncbi:unnamed protein product [Onchocerca flexuosa]|uniref:Uncharacterized protein n=1 Tax=Onchocerca flexuosa TaxID=387005 RepID=A0A183HQT7_9BILA|nr:unnamed protein product [Onchocerca flexuosa]
MIHSAPSTNTSDRSRLTSTTDHSSSLHHQTPSPVQLKNSSNQHLQRIRVSRNDPGLSGTAKRLQQWNLAAKGGSSATMQHGVDEEMNSEVRKCEIGPHSADINYFQKESKKTATTSEHGHPKVETSYDCDERNNGYRNGTSGSDTNNQYSDCNANNNGDISSERNIPVKITLEAEKVPEKNNIQSFSKNSTDSTDDDKVFSTIETASNPSQRYNLASGIAIQNQTMQQTQLGYFPLKKSADYGSTISSLTQSSNMKTEVSDIDFSWVNDVESRLEREIAFVREGFAAFPSFFWIYISL